MILTGTQIINDISQKNIDIFPFNPEAINPNSYNYTLSNEIKKYNSETKKLMSLVIPNEGYILEPHTMYLGMTAEKIGSSKYAMRLIGRSSLGRLGLFLQISADLGHVHSSHSWTLELVACLPIRIYHSMEIGQVSFWENYGDIVDFGSYYNTLNSPGESKYYFS